MPYIFAVNGERKWYKSEYLAGMCPNTMIMVENNDFTLFSAIKSIENFAVSYGKGFLSIIARNLQNDCLLKIKIRSCRLIAAAPLVIRCYKVCCIFL